MSDQNQIIAPFASAAEAAENTAGPVQHKYQAYDDNGDLVLLVGPQTEGSFRVCSRALARASEVFRKMLFGGFAESRSRYHNDTNWEVKLPEDNADGMGIFLSIVHGSFDDVPVAMALRPLYDLLALANKYDATHVVRPWARSWIQDEDVMSRTREPELLCVAWELGHHSLFKDILEKIAVNVSIGENGEVFFGTSTPDGVSGGVADAPDNDALNSLESIMPFDFTGTMKRIRSKLIDYLFRDPVNTYELARSSATTSCNFGDEKCVAQSLGSVIRFCDSIGIDITNPDAAEDYRGTASELEAALIHIRPAAPDDHEACAYDIWETFTDGITPICLMLDTVQVVPQNYLDYLRGQAEKTGLPAPVVKSKRKCFGQV